MLRFTRVVVACAGLVVGVGAQPVQARIHHCDQYIEYGSGYQLLYECGEGHPNEGCYQEIGASNPPYTSFDCTTEFPTGLCDYDTCWWTK
jgi:hypothetical protein